MRQASRTLHPSRTPGSKRRAPSPASRSRGHQASLWPQEAGAAAGLMSLELDQGS